MKLFTLNVSYEGTLVCHIVQICVLYHVALYSANVPRAAQFVNHIFTLRSELTKKPFCNWLIYEFFLKLTFVDTNASPL